jgi:hypothetical protein
MDAIDSITSCECCNIQYGIPTGYICEEYAGLLSCAKYQTRSMSNKQFDGSFVNITKGDDADEFGGDGQYHSLQVLKTEVMNAPLILVLLLLAQEILRDDAIHTHHTHQA